MRPYEIYYARRPWKGCEDERPWVVIDTRPGGVFGCFPISGQAYGGDAFYVDPTHPDFPATGLTKGCYVHYLSIIELPADQFLRRKGEFQGHLLDAFLDAAGL